MKALALKTDRSKNAIILSGLAMLLLTLFLLSLSVGAVLISVGEIVQIFLSKIGIANVGLSEIQKLVLLNIRLPRIVFTMLIGTALGISGASLQGLFRNPLVEPGIIGISSGAALGAIVFIMGGHFVLPEIAREHNQWVLPLFAFAGALLATITTLRFGSYQGKTYIVILILVGVAITSLAGAAIGLAIFYADEQQLRTYSFWTLGDLSVATWDKILMLSPIVILTTLGLTRLGRSLNALALGEAEAFHAGVNVERLKIVTILLCALAVGTSVAFVGIIGFVGLVVPHLVRMLFSPDHQLLLPASALGGACLLLVADMIGRTIVSPAELPIGIITAAIGTPFFLYVLLTAKRKGVL